MKPRFILLALFFLAVLARLCLFTVDRTEFVYVTQLGRHVVTLDGANDEQAGLHLRWPWPIQSLTRVDRRLQVLDLPAAELVTEDPSESGTIDKTLTIDAYIVWRIPDAEAAEQFILSVGTVEEARKFLRDRFGGRLGAVIAHQRFTNLISAERGQVDQQRELLRRQLLPQSTPGTPPDNGIEIVDVRIRRLNYPAQVREAIFARIKSERSRKAAAYRSRGVTEAKNIESESEAKKEIALADARNRNKGKRARADSEADLILNQAISLDRDYYAELKRRELGDLAIDKAKVKVWSTQLFRLFFPALPPLEGSKPPLKSGGD
jgi:membrane protease subunit HflC